MPALIFVAEPWAAVAEFRKGARFNFPNYLKSIIREGARHWRVAKLAVADER